MLFIFCHVLEKFFNLILTFSHDYFYISIFDFELVSIWGCNNNITVFIFIIFNVLLKVWRLYDILYFFINITLKIHFNILWFFLIFFLFKIHGKFTWLLFQILLSFLHINLVIFIFSSIFIVILHGLMWSLFLFFKWKLMYLWNQFCIK